MRALGWIGKQIGWGVVYAAAFIFLIMVVLFVVGFVHGAGR